MDTFIVHRMSKPISGLSIVQVSPFPITSSDNIHSCRHAENGIRRVADLAFVKATWFPPYGLPYGKANLSADGRCRRTIATTAGISSCRQPGGRLSRCRRRRSMRCAALAGLRLSIRRPDKPATPRSGSIRISDIDHRLYNCYKPPNDANEAAEGQAARKS